MNRKCKSIMLLKTDPEVIDAHVAVSAAKRRYQARLRQKIVLDIHSELVSNMSDKLSQRVHMSQALAKNPLERKKRPTGL
jgi:hypothetical protein